MELLIFASVALLALGWMLAPLLRPDHSAAAPHDEETAGARCAGCGAAILASARYCATCGRALDGAPAAEC